MPKAVRFEEYGGIDVLQLVEVARPTPGPGEALVHVKAAGINPGESKIRQGLLRERFPATFPSGQGRSCSYPDRRIARLAVSSRSNTGHGLGVQPPR